MANAAFEFTDRWWLPADPGRVFDALGDPDRYPLWWPCIRRVRRLDARSGELVCRSVLPFSLRLVVTERTVDRQTGLLVAELAGDLTGTASWRIIADPGAGPVGARAEFKQRVDAAGVPGGRIPLTRPLLEFNHAAMMRIGEHGLRRYLS